MSSRETDESIHVPCPDCERVGCPGCGEEALRSELRSFARAVAAHFEGTDAPLGAEARRIAARFDVVVPEGADAAVLEALRAKQNVVEAFELCSSERLRALEKALRELHDYLFDHIPDVPMMLRARRALEGSVRV